MATTTDRRERLARPEPISRPDRTAAAPAPAVPAPATAPARPGARAFLRELRLGDPIPGGWAGAGALAWLGLITLIGAVEPAPTNPDLAQPALVGALDWLSFALLVGALAGFAVRRRWGMAASLGAAAIGVVFTVMCPISGHHATVGAWWVAEMAATLGLVALSAAGLRRA